MEVIYSLKTDVSGIKQMQKASLSSEPVGLRVTNGLVGSPDWWQSIASSALPIHCLKGVVCGLWLGQGRAGPAEFKMKLPDGSLYGDLCYLEPDDAKTAFTLGREIDYDYVVQYLKSPIDGESDETNLCIEIRLGETCKMPVEPISPSEFTYSPSDYVIVEKKKPWWAWW